MFKFPLTIESLDDVPERFRTLYEASDDGFSLCDDLKEYAPQGLSNALDKERKRSSQLERDLKSWRKLGETPDDVKGKLEGSGSEYQKRIEELQEALNAKEHEGVRLDKLKSDIEKTYKGQIEEKEKLIGHLEGSLKRHLIESAAKSAIAESRGRVKPLLPTVISRLKLIQDDHGEYVVRVMDEDGDPRGDGKGGFMDIKGLLEELKSDTDYAALFEPSGTTGSGAPARSSSGGGQFAANNPWAKDSFNLTEQMRIAKSNPAMAEKLKSQAATAR